MIEKIMIGISAVMIVLFAVRESKTEGFLNTSQIYKNVKERGPELALSLVTAGFSAAFIILAFLKEIL